MRDGFKIIDADRHVLEPSDLFAKYLPEKFRSRVEIKGPNQSYRRVDGELISDADRLRDATKQEDFGFTFGASKKWRETFADALAAKFDTASNVRDMDKEGVDIGVLFPTVGLYIMWRDNLDPELSAAICRAYNTWMSDYCSASGKRLYGVALIPLQDPVRAVEELQHAKKLGLVGIFWRPNKICGRTMSSPDYDPIYATAADLGMTVCVHEGARTVLAQAGSDRYSEFGRHVACHPLEQMLACLNLCADGVLEKFPKLKVAHLESGCGWVPYMADRLDESWEHRRKRWPHPTRQSPGEIMSGGNLYYACEREERTLATVAEMIGAGQLLWASDFPHERPWDEFSGDIDTLVNRKDLPESLPRQILFDNPRRFYKLKVDG